MPLVACVSTSAQFVIVNGGMDTNGRVLSDTVVYSINDNTWTEMTTLDSDSASPQPVMMHKGVVSPFDDQLVRQRQRVLVSLN